MPVIFGLNGSVNEFLVLVGNGIWVLHLELVHPSLVVTDSPYHF